MGERPRILAWMGGFRPLPYPEISQEEKALVSILFREQCEIYSCYWGDLPKDMRRLFWNRARYDAHATFRK